MKSRVVSIERIVEEEEEEEEEENKEFISHLSLYQFEIGLNVNFEKLWNLKFQAK